MLQKGDERGKIDLTVRRLRVTLLPSGGLLCCLGLFTVTGVWAMPSAGSALTADADALWSLRAEGRRDLRADPDPIGQAIAAYETLLEAHPASLEVRWKLLRALHFYGDLVLDNREEKLALFERSRDLADESRALLHQAIGVEADEQDPEVLAPAASGVPEAVAIYYFSAVHWGLWGENTGRMKAARQGVAGKLRNFAQTVILLDESFGDAAGRRFLGRLHAEAPKIVFVTGWIDRKQAVAELERACDLAPEDPNNQLYLADALLRFRKGRRAEALRSLERLIQAAPRAQSLLEDLVALTEARTLLDRER